MVKLVKLNECLVYGHLVRKLNNGIKSRAWWKEVLAPLVALGHLMYTCTDLGNIAISSIRADKIDCE